MRHHGGVSDLHDQPIFSLHHLLRLPHPLFLLRPTHGSASLRLSPSRFPGGPAFRNAEDCTAGDAVHIAMTLDSNYLRGTMAVVLSVLQHTSCPANIAFHFLAAGADGEPSARAPRRLPLPHLPRPPLRLGPSSRPHLSLHPPRLDQPLNYARIYLVDALPRAVRRVIYLDSDVVVVDDIRALWGVDLRGGWWRRRSIATPTSRSTSRRPSGGTRPGEDLQGEAALLLQHGGDGDGRGEVAQRGVHEDGGKLDGGAEEEEDIPAGVVAAFPAGAGRGDRGR
ncbi:unnamed protein product [Spirodela intermedia]|uniref:Hexosyltransferase n=1 Tax=Spirodela intermedia TaxID=51605 RepID=A0A7I8JCG7_SPIIN|nr:unnamed protein product [Spirodela intermedia]CAA6667193.1 unnamed protein product [Spirodela intermedia]